MMSYKKVWWISLFAKLLIAAFVPLSADEAYYWVWAHFPQLSYFDHPPFVAWLFKAGTFLPDVLIRWPGILLFHFGFLFWFQILKTRFTEKQILTWLTLCLLCPFTGLGSVLVLPDSPLFFFFSASLYFFFRCLEKSELTSYAAFGAFLGLGFLSKYLIVIPTLLLALYILVEKKKEPLKPKNLLMIVFWGLVFSSPVIIWNYQNGFKSFQFQLQHGLAEGSWHWTWTADYLLGTLCLMFPLNFYWSFRAPKNSFNKVFSFLSFGGFSFFLFSSFKGSVELNWPSIFYPCLFILSLQAPFAKIIFKNILYWSLMYALVVGLFFSGLLPNLNRKINEPLEAQALAKLPLQKVPLYTSTYQLAALLWWSSGQPVYKLRDSSRYDFFDELPQSLPSAPIFYFLKEEDNTLPDWAYSPPWTIQQLPKPDLGHILWEISRKESP